MEGVDVIGRVLSRITLKLGNVKGSLVGIACQLALWCIGSLINYQKSGRLNPAMKCSMGAFGTVPKTIPLDVTTGVEMEPTPSWIPIPVVGPYMMMILLEDTKKGGSISIP